ncbi:hypothetical protein CVT25_014241 [Psilocybe cyanescens]|uniref:Uncharacterized protein n=1 Tax=Psilocybe cyanescens TaxID=93625 RepID=A0A409XJR0_PSICY|nr:hypothetical protein CVT25_014241 [Psilocybe cyanescens]
MTLSSVDNYLRGQAADHIGASSVNSAAAVDKLSSYHFDDVLHYLRKRHGFSPLDANWHPELHASGAEFAKLVVKQQRPDLAIKNILHSKHQDSSDIAQTAVGIAIADWHNMALSPDLAYAKLPPSWDIAPTGSLVCKQTHIQLQCATSTDESHQCLYVLRPARWSKDDFQLVRRYNERHYCPSRISGGLDYDARNCFWSAKSWHSIPHCRREAIEQAHQIASGNQVDRARLSAAGF